ncbi:glycolate oxidase subunit GlcE [Azoarcus sp. KH32C]|uniref:glycolate oxidase subunit GlcE n=1 Tax=Azoarcus sp. KH32C TaxID=748247 RepID=UPI0002385E90|nr:glycolate oxidase subunit GlcE [Azoarcus sp. KH32C]BAL23443.1 glycolate oxidase FAD binding subunit [Azoarcus sp. KH32C]
MSDLTEQWCERVRAAAAAGTALQIRGGGTKDFYGRIPVGELFDTLGHTGVVNYEPTELVVTVRAGTPLAELEALLATNGQMLAFEPPHFGAGATVGGCVAAGLAGPRRLAAGGVRDFVLGVKIIDGRGEALSFGGQVMKNVAGYDVSRAIAGSLGTLGLITEVSLKVLPRPVAEVTLRFEIEEQDALNRLNDWGGQPLPISGSTWRDGVLHLRLSGAEAAVRAAKQRLGGEVLDDVAGAAFWQAIREQQDGFFAPEAGEVLWRLSLPSSAAPVKLSGQQLIEWGGALRWLRSSLPADAIRERAAALGGHATAFRGFDRAGDVFHPLSAPLRAIHCRLKQAFDPAGIFNPGRFYNGI